MRTLKLYFFILTISLFVLSCSDDDDTTPFVVTTDVYVRSMNIDGSVKHAPAMLVSSDNLVSISEVVATSPSGATYILDDYWNQSFSFRYVPDTDDYTTAPPANGEYSFSAISVSSDSISNTNTLDNSEILDEVTIDTLTYNATTSSFKVVWNNVQADYYIVKLTENIDDSPLFQNIAPITVDRDEEKVSYEFNRNSRTWYSNPSQSTEYIISVHAYNIEGSTTFPIHAEFVTQMPITWGTSYTFPN